MRSVLHAAVVFFVCASAVAAIQGVVTDASGRPVVGALVAIDSRTTMTDFAGAFTLTVPDGAHSLRISRAGFRTETRTVRDGELVEVQLAPALSESMVVSGIRAEAETPVTKTNMEREEIAERYHGQDIPLLLRATPSVNAYADAGVGGSGYSYFTLRGVAATRLNFTLDGVPLADSEDMGTYFADFPDLARSLESIQIQRGVGTSSVGSPSFGGSINLQSIDLSSERTTDAHLSAGSFGSRLVSIGHQSGLLPNGFAVYTRLSYNESDGFRDRSGVRQRNLFASASKQLGDSAQLKLTGFSAREDQQLSYFATDEATLESNLRFNPLQDEERDSFNYDLAQLQYIRSLSDTSLMTASAYYQRGYGWYRLFDDSSTKSGLRQYGVDGLLLGSMVTLSQTRGAVEANYGVHVNGFEREHTRDLVDGPRDYFNYGVKREVNAFAKHRYTAGRWLLFSDAQLRWTDFAYHGDVEIDPIDWTFFNPKVGARYLMSAASSVYASAGLSTREPARNDMFQGEDNPTVAHDPAAVRPERLFDLELGWDYKTPTLTFAATAYAMEFRNEIAATGELSEIGLLLRRNVDRSHRRGLEIDAAWQLAPWLRVQTAANVSRNRIREWTQFYDVYDAEGVYVTSRPLVHRDVNSALTPSVLVNQSIDYIGAQFGAGLTGRYAGKSYLDNTNNESLTTPSFFVVDANLSLDLARWVPAVNPRLAIRVNNVLDEERIYPSGYSYPFMNRDVQGADTIDGIRYFYPQAGRNVTVMLDLRLR